MRFNGPYRQLATILLFLSLLLLLGCNGDAAPDLSLPVPEPELQVEPAAVEATTGVTQDDTDFAFAEEAVVDECLSCHTDRDMLISTAAPEEEVISENEGEG